MKVGRPLGFCGRKGGNGMLGRGNSESNGPASGKYRYDEGPTNSLLYSQKKGPRKINGKGGGKTV